MQEEAYEERLLGKTHVGGLRIAYVHEGVCRGEIGQGLP